MLIDYLDLETLIATTQDVLDECLRVTEQEIPNYLVFFQSLVIL